MKGGAGGKALVYILAESRRGQDYNRGRRQLVERFPGADGAGRCQPVHDRHLDVHQDQVEGRPQLELAYRNFPVLGLDQTVRLEEGPHQQPVVGSVFRQQDVQ